MAKAPRKPVKSFSDESLSNLLGNLQAPSPGTPETGTIPEVATQTAMTSGGEGRLPADTGSGTPPDPLQEETPTVTIANMPPDNLVLPGFAMADSPEELPDPNPRPAPLPAGIVSGEPGSRGNAMANAPPAASSQGAAPLEGEILSEREAIGEVRYESRIRVLEAYQYPGNLKAAPEWVDRNWIAYADYDPLRGIEPGPALRVPTRSGDEMVFARPGDYVVRQEVVLMHGIEPDVVIEVWAKESFEKNFIPNRSSQPKSSLPQRSARELAFDEAVSV